MTDQLHVDDPTDVLLALVVQWQESYRVNEAAKKDNSPRERMYHVHANVGATFQHCANGLGRALGLGGDAAGAVRAVVLTEADAEDLVQSMVGLFIRSGDEKTFHDEYVQGARDVIQRLIVARGGT